MGARNQPRGRRAGLKSAEARGFFAVFAPARLAPRLASLATNVASPRSPSPRACMVCARGWMAWVGSSWAAHVWYYSGTTVGWWVSSSFLLDDSCLHLPYAHLPRMPPRGVEVGNHLHRGVLHEYRRIFQSLLFPHKQARRSRYVTSSS